MKTLLAVLCLAGCSVFAMAGEIPAGAEHSCGPDQTKFDVKQTQAAIPDLATGKARLYLVAVMPQTAFTTMRFGVDGQWVGATHGTSYTYVDLDPGEHHTCVSAQTRFLPGERGTQLYGLHLEAGKTYFLRIRVLGSGDGPPPAALDLDALNADEGNAMLLRHDRSEGTPKQ